MAFNMKTEPVVRRSIAAVVANTAQLSGSIDVGDDVLTGIQTPAVLTSTTISLQGSLDGVTFVPIYTDENVLYSLTVANNAARFYKLDTRYTKPFRHIKIATGSAEGAARTFQAVVSNEPDALPPTITVNVTP